MITVTKTVLPPLEEYVAYLHKIWGTGQLTNMGPLSQELAGALKNYLNVEQLELVGNGTLALQVAIKALGLKGEIITTPYSYIATTNAVLWEGCDPVFVDIEPQSFCINPELIEAAITERTSAILATHVYGYPCDVSAIQDIADRHGLKIIYDAAHAFGVRLNGRSLLEHGDCSTLSFHATKLFHTAEGGAVVCRNADTAQKVMSLTIFGHTGEDNYEGIGINAKLSELHAAMGLAMLPRIDQIIDVRRQCAAWYDEALDGSALQRPFKLDGLEYNYAYYPVVFTSHEAMMQARQTLLANGIGPRRYFHPSLNTLHFLKHGLSLPCPLSESISERVLALPVTYLLGRAEVEKIARLLRGAAQ